MRQLGVLTALFLVMLLSYLSFGSNSNSASPLLNDLMLAAVVSLPVLVLAAFSLLSRRPPVGSTATYILVLLLVVALCFALAGWKVAALLGVMAGAALGLVVTSCVWLANGPRPNNSSKPTALRGAA